MSDVALQRQLGVAGNKPDWETGQILTGKLTAGDMLNSQEEVDDGFVVSREHTEKPWLANRGSVSEK